jgi:hypothetical protein
LGSLLARAWGAALRQFRKIASFFDKLAFKSENNKKLRQPWLKLRQNFLISVSEQQVKKTVFLTP